MRRLTAPGSWPLAWFGGVGIELGGTAWTDLHRWTHRIRVSDRSDDHEHRVVTRVFTQIGGIRSCVRTRPVAGSSALQIFSSSGMTESGYALAERDHERDERGVTERFARRRQAPGSDHARPPLDADPDTMLNASCEPFLQAAHERLPS
jgi:hypothetical protein